jgi:hypothetical protein
VVEDNTPQIYSQDDKGRHDDGHHYDDKDHGRNHHDTTHTTPCDSPRSKPDVLAQHKA